MPSRRVTAKTKIFQVEIELRDVQPAVVRRVQVPGEMTLADLHQVVQVSMSWTDSHLHEFDVDGARFGPPDPDGDDDEVSDEARAVLSRLIGVGGRMDYVYDFGDSWRHRLTVEEIIAPEPGVRYPRCLSGRRASPPEDVGGRMGYVTFLLKALADPSQPEHADYLEWAGGPFDPDTFDLAAVND